MPRYRSLFLSHGAPTLATTTHPANAFLRELGRVLPKPRAAVVVSPHWIADRHAVKQVPRHEAWHDFGGFPRALYELRYAPAGEAALAGRIVAGLEQAGLPTARDRDPRLDHGVWVPLLLMWPQADVPLVQVALGPGGPAAHWQLGEALKTILGEDDEVLVIGTGSLVHNLHEIEAEFAPARPWAQAFDGWISAQLAAGDREALIDYRRRAPSAARAHPTEDHLLPLFAAAAAGGAMTRLHESYAYGGLSMSAYGFA
ncbi:MAG: class III extradiol ring-cleavage dioxygenase [Nevskia sp.]